ncbi:MAG TPA: DUF488 domain-containing protein [Gammaproteobacteria bacterium]
MARKSRIRLKRVYDEPAKADGTRVLVDRIWPRGVRKDEAAIDEWLKEIAPSTELRKWFGHAPERWEEFRKRYEAELAENEQAVERLLDLCRRGDVTLVYAARDDEHNNARVIKELLERRLR